MSPFGKVNNKDVQLFELTNDHNIQINITNYGGIITSIQTPDRHHKSKNIVLGFDNLKDYLSKQYLDAYPYFGALIGRVGNRINKGQFIVDGKTYSVAINNGPNHLHGGLIGFDKVVWEAEPFQTKESVGVELSYLSADGEEGYPGNLMVKVLYLLNNNNELSIEYYAVTDKATPINLTQHTYFNLGAEATIENHFLQMDSGELTEKDAQDIPTGKLMSVQDTPFDFRNKKKIGQDFGQIEMGYDHNYSLNNDIGNLIKAGELTENISGRKLEVFTTEVGMQLYTGEHNPTLEINGKKKFGPYSGIALETQHYPNSVNQENFPNTVLRPNEEYSQKTIYKFSTEDSFSS
jgi:aldose 1-epimerase